MNMERAVTAAGVPLALERAPRSLFLHFRTLELESELKIFYIYALEDKVTLLCARLDCKGPGAESALALVAASVAPPEGQSQPRQPPPSQNDARAITARLQMLERGLELINGHIKALEKKVVELQACLKQ